MAIHTLLSELKRRNVYRTALVYAGVGWVLLEVADVAFPRLGLPDWTVNLVLALVLFGFPFAIIFAWIFDLGAQGIVRTEPISADAHPHRFSVTSIVEFVLICVLVLTVGYLYVDRLSLQKGMVELESAVQEKPGPRQPAVPNPEQYRAIAVLPFADMSEAGDQEWFAEGIAEELLHGLASVDELHVMARTSSFAFKDTGKTIAEIADILGVQAVLEGSVRRSGERVRVTAQLVDASSGYHIWSGSYEREITDIFALQDELAKSVVAALRVELGVRSAEPLVAEQTRNLTAYNWFLRGRAEFGKGNQENFQQSFGYFEQAVAEDPDYALAWGHLALARALSMVWHSFDEASPATITAYERALALDPEQSEGLVTKALMTQLLENDWEAAGRLYQRAMASGDNANALVAYSLFYLAHIDKAPQAIRLTAAAEKRDPLNPGRKGIHAMILIFGGDAQAAARKAHEALELNPQYEIALATLIQAYTRTGDFEAVQELLESIPPAMAARHRIRARAGVYYALRGDEEKARQIYRELQQLLDELWAPPMHYVAALALSLGEVEESIDIMERVADEHSWIQYWSRSEFKDNKALREHPRYQALLKRIGLDDKSIAALHSKMKFD